MRECIVNVAFSGRERYLLGQKRLLSSLNGVGYKGSKIFWTEKYPDGSPTNAASPYAFKYFAIKKGFDNGHKLVMWLDASMVALRPLDPMFKVVEDEGFVGFTNGCLEASWSTKECLAEIGCSLEEAKTFNQCAGGAIGFNRDNPQSMKLFNHMLALAKVGKAFRDTGNSDHPSFKAHRHDQSCLSYLVRKYGFNVRNMDFMRYSYDSRGLGPPTIIECRGM